MTDFGRFAPDEAKQILRSDPDLQSPNSRTDINDGVLQNGNMEKGRERFFHPDRGTAAPDVSGRRKQLPDGNQIGFLVTRNAGGSFQIDLVISRDDTDEMARPVTTKHERLENRSNIFAELFGHVSRGQMLLIHPIRDQFVGDFGSVEQTGRIGLFYFDVPMFHSAENSSIRIGKNNNF